MTLMNPSASPNPLHTLIDSIDVQYVQYVTPSNKAMNNESA